MILFEGDAVRKVSATEEVLLLKMALMMMICECWMYWMVIMLKMEKISCWSSCYYWRWFGAGVGESTVGDVRESATVKGTEMLLVML